MAEVSLIESGLYLGSFEAARDPELLQSLGISHVLVVASDLPYLHSFITYKNVTVDDMPDQDIESEFTGCIAFIGAALEAGGKVLVHCLSGISRSPTVVIAYLIASRHMRLDAALSLVTELHPATDPNMGFLRQLRRFESQVFQDPIQKYTCKRCRVALFTQLDLDPHTSIKVKTPHKGKGRKNYEPTKSFCSSLFVVHQPWMGEIQGNDGKLMCPKCAAKLGQYIYSGKQCSCGRFVSPAFQIHVSRCFLGSVDEVPLTVALGHVSTPRFQELLEEQKQ